MTIDVNLPAGPHGAPARRVAASRLIGRSMRDADLRADGNIFTLLRWLLASAVMFSHAFTLTGGRDADPSIDLFGSPVSRLAVLLFFSLSGFLVVGSLERRGLRDFAVSRALRLLPGLVMMLVLTGIVLGAVTSSLPVADYFAHSATRSYLLRNLLLLGGTYSLPGVFETVPVANVVNGSLWTIPQEVRCYIALALVGAAGLLRFRLWLLLLYAAALVAHLLVPNAAVIALEQPRALGLAFFFGVLLFVWRDRVFLSWPLGVAALVAALALPMAPPLAELVLTLTASYLTLVAAMLAPARLKRASHALPDYSYGIYIYGFPAQQAVIALGIGMTPYSNMAAAFVLTLAFAAPSWHLIEKPALGLKRRLLRAPGPPQPETAAAR